MMSSRGLLCFCFLLIPAHLPFIPLSACDTIIRSPITTLLSLSLVSLFSFLSSLSYHSLTHPRFRIYRPVPFLLDFFPYISLLSDSDSFVYSVRLHVHPLPLHLSLVLSITSLGPHSPHMLGLVLSSFSLSLSLARPVCSTYPWVYPPLATRWPFGSLLAAVGG